MFLKVWSSRTARWMIKGLLQLSFDDKRRLANFWLNWYKCWMGGESWHAIKKLFNPPGFLILKVRHPAVTGVYCIVGVVVVMISNDNAAGKAKKK